MRIQIPRVRSLEIFQRQNQEEPMHHRKIQKYLLSVFKQVCTTWLTKPHWSILMLYSSLAGSSYTFCICSLPESAKKGIDCSAPVYNIQPICWVLRRSHKLCSLTLNNCSHNDFFQLQPPAYGTPWSWCSSEQWCTKGREGAVHLVPAIRGLLQHLPVALNIGQAWPRLGSLQGWGQLYPLHWTASSLGPHRRPQYGNLVFSWFAWLEAERGAWPTLGVKYATYTTASDPF